MRVHAQRPGSLNWLFLPGGPGIGSESLRELIDVIEVPGTCWLADLPGDGSNVSPPGGDADPFARWPGVLIEAAREVENAVYVGHSTGGMYLLATPEVESHLVGLALVSSAPDAGWLPRFVAMTEQHPLPAVNVAQARYDAERTDDLLREIAVASAAWNFTPEGLEAGTELLRRMPYNGAAVDWSAAHFDGTYASAWWPTSLPTLILSGGSDRIVAQSLWDHPRFTGAHIIRRVVEGGGHFPWIERSGPVRDALHDLTAAMIARLDRTNPREERRSCSVSA